jgi:hypothetical protein
MRKVKMAKKEIQYSVDSNSEAENIKNSFHHHNENIPSSRESQLQSIRSGEISTEKTSTVTNSSYRVDNSRPSELNQSVNISRHSSMRSHLHSGKGSSSSFIFKRRLNLKMHKRGNFGLDSCQNRKLKKSKVSKKANIGGESSFQLR